MFRPWNLRLLGLVQPRAQMSSAWASLWFRFVCIGPMQFLHGAWKGSQRRFLGTNAGFGVPC